MTYKLEIYDANGQLKTSSSGSGVTDHGALTGLSDDDHSQYPLLAGRSGGQTIYGGTDSGDDLTIGSTSDATKGTIRLADYIKAGQLVSTDINGNLGVVKANYDSAGDPNVNYDVDADWEPGSLLINTTGKRAWMDLDNTDAAAIWREITHPMTTAGDVLYFNGTLLTRLAIGTAGQRLTVNAGATAPEWQDVSGSASRAIVEDQKSQNTDGGTFTTGAWRTRLLNTIVNDADSIISITYLDFTSGGTYEVQIGDEIEGDTSGATATIFGIELDSGTWAGGDAAGTFWLLDDQSGTFQSETISVGANSNVATIGADSVTDGNFALLAGTYFIDAILPAYDVSKHQGQLYNITDSSQVKAGSSCDAATGGNVMNQSRIKTELTIASLKVFQLQHRCAATKADTGFGEACNFTTEVYTQMEVQKKA
jgi:hypothetical protein